MMILCNRLGQLGTSGSPPTIQERGQVIGIKGCQVFAVARIDPRSAIPARPSARTPGPALQAAPLAPKARGREAVSAGPWDPPSEPRKRPYRPGSRDPPVKGPAP